ncbi:hypothetical protein [Paeniglutamicibacter terrestris]|uniref:Uncharacterized protein n=1 Tax=Paeniglutamicibacter terrestris TaxID=2723403 RepID=A0ABX1FZL0_9MICC|nr:hypothetical protein [Paeniglutamicibacter terrestris]NKG19149.1 hypothetical protein [Paeniglutamicibacter terrestris]
MYVLASSRYAALAADGADTGETGDCAETGDTGETGDCAETGDTGETADFAETGDTAVWADTGDVADFADTADGAEVSAAAVICPEAEEFCCIDCSWTTTDSLTGTAGWATAAPAPMATTPSAPVMDQNVRDFFMVSNPSFVAMFL